MSTTTNIDAMKYVSLATYRRNGQAVQTPVWIAGADKLYYVFSEATAGKIKRIRNNEDVRICKCTMRGNLLGPWIEMRARIVKDPATIKTAYAHLTRKYGFIMRITNFYAKLSGRYQNRAMIELELIN